MRESVNATMSSTMRKIGHEISKLGLRIRSSTPTNSDSEAVYLPDEVPSPRESAAEEEATDSPGLDVLGLQQNGSTSSRQRRHSRNGMDEDVECCQRKLSIAASRPGLTHRSRSDMAKYSSPQIRKIEDGSPTTENIPETECTNGEEISPMPKSPHLLRPGLTRKSRSDLAKYSSLSSRMTEGLPGVRKKAGSSDDLQTAKVAVCERGLELFPRVRYQVSPSQQKAQVTEPKVKPRRFRLKRSKSSTILLLGKSKSKETNEPDVSLGVAEDTKTSTLPRSKSFSHRQVRRQGMKESRNDTFDSQPAPNPDIENHTEPAHLSRYRNVMELGLSVKPFRNQRPLRKSWTYEDIIGAPAPYFIFSKTSSLNTHITNNSLCEVHPDNNDMLETDLCSTEL